ncbi:MAG: hypothetical protein MI723_17520 [Caulobacterales bacterium]|nr:hypothetical protein [Caulobacterales bacterium]
MAISPIERAVERTGWPVLETADIDAFLEEGGPSILFFAGDSTRRPEAADVAVILPEIHAAFGACFRVGVIATDALPAAKERFNVHFLPTLTLMRGADLVGHIPRVQDWSVYQQKIGAFLRECAAQDREAVDG